MKTTFAAVTLALIILSLIAWRSQPPPSVAGKMPLVWVSDDNPLRKAQIARFESAHPTLDLKLDSANNALEKTIVQSLAGVGPDVFDCGSAAQLSAYVKSGVAMDITDVLKKDGIDVATQTFTGCHGPAILDGHVYGVPTNISADGIWFHKDIFREEGVPFPKGPYTWPDFLKLAEKMTKKDANGRITRYGLLFEWYGWQNFLYAYGGRVFSPDGKTCTLDAPNAIAAIQLMGDLIWKYHVSPSPSEEAAMATNGGWGSGGITYFGSKRGAMALGGRWWLATLGSYNLDLGVAVTPTGNSNDTYGYGRATLVNKNAKNLKGAIEFLKYLAGPTYNGLINEQKDGVCAFEQYAKFPQRSEADTWLQLAKRAVPGQVSPYIDGNVSDKLIQIQLDLVKAGDKTADQAMHDAARDINTEIQKNIAKYPSLKAQYDGGGV